MQKNAKQIQIETFIDFREDYLFWSSLLVLICIIFAFFCIF